MRSDDAIETFKRHAEYEETAGHGKTEEWNKENFTGPIKISKYEEFIALSYKRHKSYKISNRVIT